MKEACLVYDVSKGWSHFLKHLSQQKQNIHILLPSDEATQVLKNRLQNYPEIKVHCYTPLTFLNFYLESYKKQKYLLPPLVAKIMIYEKEHLPRFSSTISDDELLNIYSKNRFKSPELYVHPEKYLLPCEILNFLNAEKELKLFETGVIYGFTASHEKDDYLKAFLRASSQACIFAFAPTPKVWVKQFVDSVKTIGVQGNISELTIWTAKNPVQESRFVSSLYASTNESALVVSPISPEYKFCLNQFLSNDEATGFSGTSTEDSETLSAWIDWQQNNSLENFGAWIQSLNDCPTKIKEELRKIFDQAFNTCLTDNFLVLHRFLNERLKSHEKFLHVLIEWPDKAEWEVFVDLTLKSLSQRLSDCAKALFETYVFFNGLIVEKRTFFEAFKVFLIKALNKNYSSYGLSIETVAIFPWKNIFIPFLNQSFCSNISKAQKRFYRQCFHFLCASKATLILSLSRSDIEGNALSECFWLKDLPQSSLRFKNISDAKVQFEGRKETNYLKTANPAYTHDLPEGAIFPCKTWEWFIQNPERAWLENVLKLSSNNSYTNPFIVRPRIIGEWVHENLSFVTVPKTKECWLKSVREKAYNLRTQVNSAYITLPYFWLQTWEHALSIAETIVHTHGNFDVNFEHYSEKPLPQTRVKLPQIAQSLTTYGRVDWLISEVKLEDMPSKSKGQPIAEVIDYKTNEKFPFTLPQLVKGVGLQLILYGLILEELGYHDILLSVILPNGKKSSHSLNSIKEDLSDIWIKLCDITQKKLLGRSRQLKYAADTFLPIATL